MMRLWVWFQSWYETLYIKYRQPDLYRELTKPLDTSDFGEVGPPE